MGKEAEQGMVHKLMHAYSPVYLHANIRALPDSGGETRGRPSAVLRATITALLYVQPSYGADASLGSRALSGVEGNLTFVAESA